jgi:hypothetical protein
MMLLYRGRSHQQKRMERNDRQCEFDPVNGASNQEYAILSSLVVTFHRHAVQLSSGGRPPLNSCPCNMFFNVIIVVT